MSEWGREGLSRLFGEGERRQEAAATQYLYTEKARRTRRRHEESPVVFRRVGRRTDMCFSDFLFWK
jgi:hypothetical protein